jgi:Mn-dependent DtxR family transcriptional regulator
MRHSRNFLVSKILRVLEDGGASLEEIAREMQVSRKWVMRELRYLREVGMVSATSSGIYKRCRGHV